MGQTLCQDCHLGNSEDGKEKGNKEAFGAQANAQSTV